MAGPSAPRSPDVVSLTNSSWPPEPGSRPQPVWRRRPGPRWAETSDQQDRPDWKDRVDPAGSAGHRRSEVEELDRELVNRKSTRLNSSHVSISYAVFCLKKKNNHAKIGHKSQYWLNGIHRTASVMVRKYA